MRVGFAGTPAFAARTLSALHEAGYTIPLVLTQPDRPHGRGMKVSPSPVRSLALDLGLPVHQPASLKPEGSREPLLAVPLDVLVVAAYGLILPPAVLAWPRHGCLNVHASRLPRWRGAAPIARAIEAGDVDTGITIMQMDVGLDTGPMIAVAGETIGPRDTTGALEDRLGRTGAVAIVAALAQLAADGSLASRPQPDSGVTYAAKITKDEAMLDWRRPARTLDRQVRAFDPAPGAWTVLEGSVLKIVEAHPGGTGPAAPGGTATGLGAEGLDVACGADGGERLCVRVVKPAGRKAMTAAAFVAGHKMALGSRFELPPRKGTPL